MRKELLIIGCGNVGGFVSYNIEDAGDFSIIGFLDDDPTKHGKSFYGSKVLGHIDELVSFYRPGLSVALAISSPKAKRAILNRLTSYELDFPTLIFKNVWISKNVSIGKGTIVYPGVSVNYETLIGDFVTINMNCAIGHNTTLSKFCTLAPGVNLAGFTFLEQGVEVGIGVSTKQNVRIGENAVIGGQSMVIRNISADTTVKGVPAQETK